MLFLVNSCTRHSYVQLSSGREMANQFVEGDPILLNRAFLMGIHGGYLHKFRGYAGGMCVFDNNFLQAGCAMYTRG